MAWNSLLIPAAPDANRAALDASPLHAEALARLEFLATSRSPLGLLLGPAGCGKSSVLTEFANRAQRQGFVTAHAALTATDDATFLGDLAQGLNLEPAPTSWQSWRQITDRFAELQLQSLHAILLLDDLDRAPPAPLALVERLLSLAAAPFTIAASARPETVLRLGPRILEHASLRIDLSPWSEAETADYITRRSLAGSSTPAFEPTAARRLFELSAGTPRQVNHLALLAEIAASGQGRAIIDDETVLAVHEELTFR